LTVPWSAQWCGYSACILAQTNKQTTSTSKNITIQAKININNNNKNKDKNYHTEDVLKIVVLRTPKGATRRHLTKAKKLMPEKPENK